MGFNYYGDLYMDYYEDPLEVECDMFENVPIFWGFDDRYEYEHWEYYLEEIFSYFDLTNKRKCWYAKHRLVGEAFARWTKNCKYCQTWSHMKIDLRHQ